MLDSLIKMSALKKCVILFLGALIIRVVGIDYGYWHGDERIGTAAKVLTGELVPGQHFYPPLLNYINAIFFGGLYLIGRLIPVWYDTGEFRAQYFSDPTAFYLTARFVVSLLSALTAPVFFLIGKSLRFGPGHCLLMGLFGAFIPVMVLLSHISKSDVGLASFTIITFYLLFLKFENLEKKKYDVLLGLSVATALSFKHSYVFIMLPLLLGYIYLLLESQDLKKTLWSISISLLVMIPAWCVMNIGIILDFDNFLDFQKIQAQMSIQEGVSYGESLQVWFEWASHKVSGVNALITIAFLLFPFYLFSKFCNLPKKKLIAIMWLSIFLSTLFVVKVSGIRQHSGLWVPYFTAMQLFAALLLVDALRNGLKSIKITSAVAVVMSLVVSLFGTMLVWKQALAKPVAIDVAELIQEKYSDRKILTSYQLPLEKDIEARDLERARHQRLADKYGIVLPVEAEERFETQPVNPIFFYNMPDAMFGLQNIDDESLGESMKAYTWPVQPEEWRLKHWLDKGVSIIVLADHEYFLTKSDVREYREFHKEIADKCEVIFFSAARKPDLVEFPFTVYDCANTSG